MAKLSQRTDLATTPAPVRTLNVTAQLELAPVLDTIAMLKEQRLVISELIDAETARVMDAMEEDAVESATIKDWSLAIVRGTTTKLNTLKLFAMGVTQAQLDDATERRPKKPYVRIGRVGQIDPDA